MSNDEFDNYLDRTLGIPSVEANLALKNVETCRITEKRIKEIMATRGLSDEYVMEAMGLDYLISYYDVLEMSVLDLRLLAQTLGCTLTLDLTIDYSVERPHTWEVNYANQDNTAGGSNDRL